MKYSNLTSQTKFIIAFVAGFAVLWIPAELGNLLLDKIRIAIEVAFLGTGGYKVAQVIGNKVK